MKHIIHQYYSFSTYKNKPNFSDLYNGSISVKDIKILIF